MSIFFWNHTFNTGNMNVKDNRNMVASVPLHIYVAIIFPLAQLKNFICGYCAVSCIIFPSFLLRSELKKINKKVCSFHISLAAST